MEQFGSAEAEKHFDDHAKFTRRSGRAAISLDAPPVAAS
jgi:hypothetical protein